MVHEIHPHHQIALQWAKSLDAREKIFYCRFTQLGMLRLLTNKVAMGEAVLSMNRAWAIHDQFIVSYWRTIMVEEPQGTEELLRRFTKSDQSSTKLWADAYLAAFAEAANFRLVTFDKGLARLASGTLLLGGSQQA